MSRASAWATIRRAALAGVLLAAWAALLPGCASARAERLEAPKALVAPYDVARGEVLWAVVPLRNESGTALVDAMDVSDKVVAASAQVRGVRVLPLNRTIAAMRALKLSELSTPAEARRLSSELGVDALLVGSITAWDPYRPTLGLSLALYARPGPMNQRGPAAIDVSRLRYSPTDYSYFPRSAFDDAPSSVVAEHLDGANHQVLMDVRQYATGRHDRETALGWRRYTASMGHFTEFAAWHTVGRLVEHEWIRMTRLEVARPAEDRPEP